VIEDRLKQGVARSESGEMREAEIDENLEQTFPASDSPSWTLGSDHRSGAEEKSEGDDPGED
jgi:hypothetical protein